MIIKNNLDILFEKVNHEWLEAPNSDSYNDTQFINKGCSEKYKINIEKYMKEDSGFKMVRYLISDSILVFIYEKGISCATYINDSIMKISDQMYNQNFLPLKRAKGNFGLESTEASFRLESHIAKACAISLTVPKHPDKNILFKGVADMDEKLAYTEKTGKLNDIEQKASINAAICALLINETELAHKFLTRWKNHAKYKKHVQVFKLICKELIKTKNTCIGDFPKIIEEKYFEIFNAYRHPVHAQCHKALNVAPPINHILLNYLLSWLYLKLFKGQTETTWEELRIIMMT